MQGAPIAEDVAHGRDGDWPFPLMPQPRCGARARLLAPLPAAGARRRARRVAAAERRRLRIAPGELARMPCRPRCRGTARRWASPRRRRRMVVFAQALRASDARGGAACRDCRGRRARARARCACACARSISALRARADLARRHRHATCVGRCRRPPLARRRTGAARRATRPARRCVVWRDDAALARVAGPGARGPWYAACGASDAAVARRPLLRSASRARQRLRRGLRVRRVAAICLRPPARERAHAAAGSAATVVEQRASSQARRTAWLRERPRRSPATQFDALAQGGGARCWVPERRSHASCGRTKAPTR